MIFLYELAMLCGLVALAFVYYEIGAVRDLVPELFQRLPVEVAWFGALGGVAISLKGVYDHPVLQPLVPPPPGLPPADAPGTETWDNRWVIWHIGRPFSGMLAGIVTLLLLKAVSTGAPRHAVVLAAAFILGTQERRFFEFLKEVGALIVAVPKSDGVTVKRNG